MKLKMYLALLAFGCMSFSLLACSDDDDHGVSVPAELENAFVSAFGQVGHSWETRGAYYVADFHENHAEVEAWFDGQGKWLMTETDIPYESLPAAVKSAFESGSYAQWKREDIDMVERRDMETVYIIEVELGHQEMDLYYDASGNLLKEILDTDNNSEHYLPAVLPDAVKTLLTDKYPNYKLLEVDREQNGYLEVDILFNNRKLEVIFGQDNSWVATKMEVRLSDVPEAAKKAALDAYPGAMIDDDEADFVETPTGSFYVIELEKGGQDIYVKVTGEGTVIQG